MFGFVAGMITGNAVEWVAHKYILHGRGKKRSSFWSFHFHEHHRASRQHQMVDEHYHHSVLQWNAQGKEVIALVGGAALAIPLAPLAPGFVAGLWTHGAVYYVVHKKAHLDEEWGRKWLAWHYDHHMGPNQDCNWCVTYPLFDWIMGTRVPYKGTEKERVDRQRRQARSVARSPVVVPLAAPSAA